MQRYLQLTNINHLRGKDLRKQHVWLAEINQCHLKVNQVTNRPLSLKICIPERTLSCSIHLKDLQKHEENCPSILLISIEEPCTLSSPNFASLPSYQVPVDFTNLSTSPLALGQRGVTFRCLKPSTHANFVNSSPLNGGPLSDLTTRGAPNVENS